jgi:3-oxoadipate enol-lactonase
LLLAFAGENRHLDAYDRAESMPKIRANGIELFFEESGAGEPLLLIAGFACDHTNWRKLVPSLASSYRLITFDNRGVGQSTSPATPYTIDQMAEDTIGLLDAIDLTSVHIAGHSMGGQIALELALACPGRVKSLILLSSCAKMDERGRTVIELWGDFPKLLDPATAIRLSFPWIYTARFYATPGAIDEVIKEILANPFPPSASGIYQQSRAITSYDASARLREIKCPTLVIVGDEDILGGLSLSADLAHHNSRGAARRPQASRPWFADRVARSDCCLDDGLSFRSRKRKKPLGKR